MDPSSAHQQIMSEESLESMLACSKAQQQEDHQKKARPQPEQALKCPRCDSTNTKFCYYNNYSLSQPRYFCKSCRRYWTKGGTLRNVPVGGGCRKNKRPSSSSSSSKRGGQDQAFLNTNHHHNINNNNNPFSGFPQLSCYDSSNDFALAIAARLHKGQQFGFDDHHDLSILGSTISTTPCDILGLHNNNNNNNNSAATTTTGFLDALRSGFLGTPNNNNNVQNLYYGGYGNNNGDMGEVVDNNNNNNNGGGDMNMVLPYDQEMNDTSVATTQAVTVTTMKQEICSGGGRELLLQQSGDHNSSSNHSNRVLWGFPWQMIGSDTNMADQFDSARASCWNNLNSSSSSSWHGLLNSPLM